MMIKIRTRGGNFYFTCLKCPFCILAAHCSTCDENDCICKDKELIREYYKNNSCGECGSPISYIYFVLIKNLKETGLLPENFKNVCCNCFKLINIGRTYY